MSTYKPETCPEGYVPFTYIIRWKYSGRVYYGSKYAKQNELAHPDMLWSTYFTSSKVIKALIEEFGEWTFDYEVRQVFATAEEAHEWERRVLARFDAKRNPKFFNNTNGNKKAFKIGSLTSEEVERRTIKRNQTMKRNGTSCGVKKGTKKKGVKTGKMSAEAIILRSLKQASTRAKNGTNRTRRYVVKDPQGIIHEGDNLHQFCKKNGLNSGNMQGVCSGRLRHSSGWTGQYTKQSTKYERGTSNAASSTEECT